MLRFSVLNSLMGFLFLGLLFVPLNIQAQKYNPADVAVINVLIAKNGLNETPDDPASWRFITWDKSYPKKIIRLKLNNRGLYGAASFAGLTHLQTLMCKNNNLTELDVTKCTQLKWLECKNNNLAELDVTKCVQLQTLTHNKNVKLITEKEALDRETNTFSYFAKNYMEQWLQKGEFEKTDDWQQRISENNRKAREAELLKEAEQAFIAERSKNLPVGNITLGNYNADKEEFLIINSVHGNWLEPVPIDEAPKFRDNWNDLVKIPQYVIRNDRITFVGYRFELVDITAASDNAIEQKENQTSPTAANTKTAKQGDESVEDPYKFRFYIGTGIGYSYGILGISCEARFDQFGVHAGIGRMPLLDTPSWSIGTKWYFWKNLYFDTMVGVVGEQFEFEYKNGSSYENHYAIIGLTPSIGVNWSWGGRVRFGINAGVGFAYGFKYGMSGVAYDAGINISFGTK